MITYSTSTLTASVSTLQIEPINSFSNISFSDIYDTGYKLFFTKPSDADDIIILQKSGTGSITGEPIDATEYSVNDTIGDGVVIYKGHSVSAQISSLSSNTTYSYKFIAYSGSGESSNYNLSTTAFSSTSTLINQEPPSPTNFVLNSKSTDNNTGMASISFSFNSVTASGINPKYLVLYNSSTSITAIPTDYTVYSSTSLGDGLILSSNTATSFSLTSLNDDTQYYFKIFSYGDSNTAYPNYNVTALTASIFTNAITPSDIPQNLITTTSSNTSLTFQWNVPLSGYYSGYLLAYKQGNYNNVDTPINNVGYNIGNILGSSNTAYVGYSGNSLTSTITGLSQNTEYTFFLFTKNGSYEGTTANPNGSVMYSATSLNLVESTDSNALLFDGNDWMYFNVLCNIFPDEVDISFSFYLKKLQDSNQTFLYLYSDDLGEEITFSYSYFGALGSTSSNFICYIYALGGSPVTLNIQFPTNDSQFNNWHKIRLYRYSYFLEEDPTEYREYRLYHNGILSATGNATETSFLSTYFTDCSIGRYGLFSLPGSNYITNGTKIKNLKSTWFKFGTFYSNNEGTTQANINDEVRLIENVLRPSSPFQQGSPSLANDRPLMTTP